VIITVTANTTIDLTLFVPNLVNNRTIRATQSIQSMGGKPTDASWILGELGIPSLALGFAGGSTGKKVEIMLEQRGVTPDFVWLEQGETRINVVIIPENTDGSITITTNTMTIETSHVEQLRGKLTRALANASCVITGGSLPEGLAENFYVDFIALAKTHNKPVIFDAAGANLRAGLTARPDHIKPNRDELAELIGHPVESIDDAYIAGCELIAQYGTAPIITLGEGGALAVLPERAYFIPPLRIKVVSPNGAGDAVLAGIASAYERNQPIEDGLKLGFAAAAAVCLQPGTADCRKADVEQFIPQIELMPYP
jgi:1-phosphofructokinase family hexose kinase